MVFRNHSCKKVTGEMVKRCNTYFYQYFMRNNDIIKVISYKILVISCFTAAYDMVFHSNAMCRGSLETDVKPLLKLYSE